MSCFYVIAWLRVCSSRALSRLRALFRVGAWRSDPCFSCLEFRFRVRVQTFTLHVLSRFWSMRSRVHSAARSSVHVCCVVARSSCFIGCMHSCYVLCCVARSLCFSLAACFHVVMSCVNTWLMSFLISCVFMCCFAHSW